MVELLLEKGWHREPKDKYNRTPLMISCLYGHSAVCEILLTKSPGAAGSVDHRDRTPVHFAALASNAGPMNLLMKWGAPITSDAYKRTALHYASSSDSKEA